MDKPITDEINTNIVIDIDEKNDDLCVNNNAIIEYCSLNDSNLDSSESRTQSNNSLDVTMHTHTSINERVCSIQSPESMFIDQLTLFIYNKTNYNYIKNLLSIDIPDDVIDLIKLILVDDQQTFHDIVQLLLCVIKDEKIDFNDTSEIIEIIQIMIKTIKKISKKKLKYKKYFTVDNCSTIISIMIKIIFHYDIILCDQSYESKINNIVDKTVSIIKFTTGNISLIKKLWCW
jgi:hypothetical protein